MKIEINNLSNQIKGDKSEYIGNIFFERLKNSDENIQKFSSLISDTLFSNLIGKNPSDKFNKIKNSKAAKFPKHIIQSFGFYILIKYNTEKKSIESKEQVEKLVDNFYNEIEKYSEEQLKNLYKNIFSITKKTYGEITGDYNEITKINNYTSDEVHKVLGVNQKNINDIIVERSNMGYLPKLLQYLLYPKLGLNLTNSIIENNLDADKKTLKSNFSVFTEVFKLRNTFKSINEIYKYLDKYFEENRTQKIVDFYRYYDPKSDSYKDEMYLVQQNEKLNYTNIFFQWFIEQKKQNKTNYNDIENIDNNTELCLDDLLNEFNELIELFGEDFEENNLNNERVEIGNKKIYEHLFSLDDGFFYFEELTNTLKKIEKSPNSFNTEDITDTYIDIKLVENGIILTHYYKILKHNDYLLPISTISFLKDENNNIIKSENHNEIFKNILEYIDGYLDKKILKENIETLKYLILNGIITNIIGFKSQNDYKWKLSFLINGFNVKEKSNTEFKKYEQNIFPIKNVKHQINYSSLDNILLENTDELFIGDLKVDLPNLNDLITDDENYKLLLSIKENKLEITKEIFIKFIKEGNIKSFTKLSNFLDYNRDTLNLLKKNTSSFEEIKYALKDLIKELYEQNWNIKLGPNYTLKLNKLFKLYEISKQYDLSIDENDIKKILRKIDIILIVRYLGITLINDNDSYNIIVEQLNEDVNYKIKNLLDYSEYFNEKLNIEKYSSITDKIEQIIENLGIYISILSDKNKILVKNTVIQIFLEKYIDYFDKVLKTKTINDEKYSGNEEYYYIFYAIKRLVKIITDKLGIEGIDFSFFNSHPKTKNYNADNYLEKSKRKRLTNKSKKIHTDENIESNQNNNQKIKTNSYYSNKSIKDIHSSIDKYIEVLTTKYKIYNHINNIDNNLDLQYIENFINENNDITYFFDSNKEKIELLLMYLSKITLKGINIYESKIIFDFLVKNFELFKMYYLKQYYLNYLYLLGFFEYTYSKETGNKNSLTQENILLIEEILIENKDIYEIVKNHIIHISREVHNNQIAKL